MAPWRVIFAAILSSSLLQAPLSCASSSALGAIVYADHSCLDAGNASAGATVFSGDKLRTEPACSLQIRTGAARLELSSSSSATLIREDDRPAAILTTGSAIFSTANSKAFIFHVSAAVIRPNTDLPTIGQLTVLNPREFLVKSIRASLRITVEDDVREIPEGGAYRIVLESTTAEPDPQGPRGAGTKGYSDPPKFPRGIDSSGYPSPPLSSSSQFGPCMKPSKAPTVPNSFLRVCVSTRKNEDSCLLQMNLHAPLGILLRPGRFYLP